MSSPVAVQGKEKRTQFIITTGKSDHEIQAAKRNDEYHCHAVRKWEVGLKEEPYMDVRITHEEHGNYYEKAVQFDNAKYSQRSDQEVSFYTKHL